MAKALREYFEYMAGTGVLSMSEAAICSTPQVIDDRTEAFIMRGLLMHENLKTNASAAYLFLEDRSGTSLFLYAAA